MASIQDRKVEHLMLQGGEELRFVSIDRGTFFTTLLFRYFCASLSLSLDNPATYKRAKDARFFYNEPI